MNYKKIHDHIISLAQTRTLVGYAEKHHIIPKCIGGDNTTMNLVDLTAREHFVIHQLLVKMYPDSSGLKYAVFMMSNVRSNKTQEKYRINNRCYGWIREQHSRNVSRFMLGNTHGTGLKMGSETRIKMSKSHIGQKHTAETKQKMSLAQKGNKGPLGHRRSDETKRRMSLSKLGSKNPNYGKTASKETLKKRSTASRDRIWITDGITNRMIKKWDSIPKYWYRGRK